MRKIRAMCGAIGLWVIGITAAQATPVAYTVKAALPTSIKGNVTCNRDNQPIANATMTIADSGNNVVGSTTTAADGSYAINGLVAGSYSVTLTPPENTKVCGDATVRVALECNQDGMANFCVCACLPSNVMGQVVCSRDNTGIAGVTVSIVDENDAVIASAVTAADGIYTIGGINPGNYTARITPIDNTVLCGPDSMAVTVECELDAIADFCLCPCQGSVISGTVRCVKDCISSPQANTLVTVYDSANVSVASATTDANGGYSIPDLQPGHYTVAVTVPANDEACGNVTQAVTLTCERNNTADFCLCPPTTTCATKIRGTVKCSSVGPKIPVPGATINVVDKTGVSIATQQTTADGTYSIQNLPAGDYSVKLILPAGYDACGKTSACVVLTCDQRKVVDFCACPTCTPATVSGEVKCSSSTKPMANVTIKAYSTRRVEKGTATTDADGRYTLSLPAGSYQIKMIVPEGDEACSETRQSVSLSCGQSKTVDFCLCQECPPARMTGTVKCISTGNGISRVVVKVYDGNNQVQGSATTACGGQYRINNLPAGTYTVKMTVPCGYEACGDTSPSVILVCGQSKVVDFCLCPRICSPAEVSGAVQCSSPEQAISGATVKLHDRWGVQKGCYTTRGDGQYRFGNLAAGDYTVTLTPPSGDETCGDASVSVTLACGQSKCVNFCACPPMTPLTSSSEGIRPVTGRTIPANDRSECAKRSTD